MIKLKKLVFGAGTILMSAGTALGADGDSSVPFNLNKIWNIAVGKLGDSTWASPLNWVWDNISVFVILATILFLSIAALKSHNARKGGSVSGAVQSDNESVNILKRFGTWIVGVVIVGLIAVKFVF